MIAPKYDWLQVALLTSGIVTFCRISGALPPSVVVPHPETNAFTPGATRLSCCGLETSGNTPTLGPKVTGVDKRNSAMS